MANLKRIGIVTSGGDAPGMNPCIRAAVRTALFNGCEVIGIRDGFDGLLAGNWGPLQARDVGGIIQRGGTMLGTARSEEFYGDPGQDKGAEQMRKAGIDGLVCIGGDGTMRGAHGLAARGIHVVGAPASIDNDVWGTNMAIGVDTALNTICDAIDRLRDTASSHHRAFLIETMGRNCGYLAVMGGVIGGAEVVLIPEVDTSIEEVAERIGGAYQRRKTHAIVIVAEGAKVKIGELSKTIDAMNVGFTTRITILGHIQRGGRPSAFDRLLATRFGVKAVDALLAGQTDVMMGLQGREIVPVALEKVTTKQREANLEYFEMAKMLAF